MILNWIRVNEDLLIVKRVMATEYESLAPEWNKISPLHRTFKREDKLYFCELVEEAEIVNEAVENPVS